MIKSISMKSILSKREKEVLNFIAQEFTTSEIGIKLHLSSNTVETHRRNILNKFSVRNTAGMVRRGFELGLLKINSTNSDYGNKFNY